MNYEEKVKAFDERLKNYHTLLKCYAAIDITHDEDDDFRLYGRKLYYAIRPNASNSNYELEAGYSFCDEGNLPDPEWDESETEEWKRYNAALASAVECFIAFTKTLSPLEWEDMAAASLARPGWDVPLRGFVPPTIPGFEISASMLVYSADADEILNAMKEEEAEEDEEEEEDGE